VPQLFPQLMNEVKATWHFDLRRVTSSGIQPADISPSTQLRCAPTTSQPPGSSPTSSRQTTTGSSRKPSARLPSPSTSETATRPSPSPRPAAPATCSCRTDFPCTTWRFPTRTTTMAQPAPRSIPMCGIS
jgi:hypothetical protein